MQIANRQFRVHKFGFFSCDDPWDMRFQHEICWSRIYEYPFVLQELRNIAAVNPRIHNCSWGHCDIHLVFKTWLDLQYPNTIHSDIRQSTLYNAALWDITMRPTEIWHEAFDGVINVSTLEEVATDHCEILRNHLIQLRPLGRFVATFDYPGLQLDRIEEMLNEKIATPPRRLTPRTSRLEDKVLGLADDFGVGYLVIEREH